MNSRNTNEARQIAAAGLAALMTAAGLVAVTAPTATGDTDGAAAGATGDCRVVRMKQPDGFMDGAVIDIEQVGDQVVYFGNSYSGPGERARQRAFVWYGLGAEPVQVGPRGRWDLVIALELTETGLINGTAESFDGSVARSWVQDLSTGEIRWFDVDSGPRGEDHGFTWIRRINDSGAGAGTAFRSDDPEGEPGTDAVGLDAPEAPMEFLSYPVDYLEAGAFGINNQGDRIGYLADEFLDPEAEFWTLWEPTIWHADGTRTTMATPFGREAFPREIEDDGGAAGSLAWGEDPMTAHLEAAYWPSADVSIALGLLPGGVYSDAFGADHSGRVVGLASRMVRRPGRFAPEGFVDHSFWWSPQSTPETVRVLPSLYGRRHDLGWHEWVGRAAHAVNTDLDQAGSTTHAGFDRDRLVFAPTVFVNASACGREVRTGHELPAAGRAVARRAPGLLGRDWHAAVQQ